MIKIGRDKTCCIAIVQHAAIKSSCILINDVDGITKQEHILPVTTIAAVQITRITRKERLEIIATGIYLPQPKIIGCKHEIGKGPEYPPIIADGYIACRLGRKCCER